MNSSASSIPSTDGVAIASLVLAMMSVMIGPFGSIPAIICGHLARGRIRRDPLLTGHGLATAGLIIGYLTLFLMGVMIIIFTGMAAMPRAQ